MSIALDVQRHRAEREAERHSQYLELLRNSVDGVIVDPAEVDVTLRQLDVPLEKYEADVVRVAERRRLQEFLDGYDKSALEAEGNAFHSRRVEVHQRFAAAKLAAEQELAELQAREAQVTSALDEVINAEQKLLSRDRDLIPPDVRDQIKELGQQLAVVNAERDSLQQQLGKLGGDGTYAVEIRRLKHAIAALPNLRVAAKAAVPKIRARQHALEVCIEAQERLRDDAIARLVEVDAERLRVSDAMSRLQRLAVGLDAAPATKKKVRHLFTAKTKTSEGS